MIAAKARPLIETRNDYRRRASTGVLILKVPSSRDFSAARVLESNAAAATLLRLSVDEMMRKRLRELPLLDQRSVTDRLPAALDSGEYIDLGPLRRGRRQNKSSARIRARVFGLPKGRVALTLEDSSAQAAVEQAVKRSEEGFHLLIHSVKDYAIYMLDPHGKILSWNEGAERLEGYSSREIIGKKYDVFFTAEDRKAGKPKAQLQQAEKAGQSEDEGWLVRKDGWAFWANSIITALHDDQGRIWGFAKITRDMTERREREASINMLNEHLEARIEARTAELTQLNETLQTEVRERKNAEEQMRALAARQERVREDERTRLAREIHDEFGQMCTALKMDIAWIAKRLPKDEVKLADKSQAALKLVGELIKSLRQVSTELRPSMLDTLGLVSAIEWQAQQFESHTGIRCELFLPEKDFYLDKERSTAIFRIFQETLTNVARHARAKKVKTSLMTADHSIALITHDNGKGFEPSTVEGRGSFGLLGMKERAHLLGGELKVSSRPGKGTTVAVHMPLAPRQKS